MHRGGLIKIPTLFGTTLVVRQPYQYTHTLQYGLYQMTDQVEAITFLQVDEEEEPAGKGFELSGRDTRGRTTRGRTTRGRTQRRGISKYRQTQRKPRSIIRSSGHGTHDADDVEMRLTDDIQLQEVSITVQQALHCCRCWNSVDFEFQCRIICCLAVLLV